VSALRTTSRKTTQKIEFRRRKPRATTYEQVIGLLAATTAQQHNNKKKGEELKNKHANKHKQNNNAPL
jgi:hypothetical protein